MRILLVEDDENKSENIRRFLAETFPKADVEMERSVHSGLKRIKSVKPDLLLLDMTLPTFDVAPNETGGSPRIFGGREILRQLDRFRIEIPVVVVTQFETFEKDFGLMRLDDLNSELGRAHGRNYLGVVYYNAAIHDWKETLRLLIFDLHDSQRDIERYLGD